MSFGRTTPEPSIQDRAPHITGPTGRTASPRGDIAETGEPARAAAPFRMGFAEFVVFVAACMALNALAIDIMLPALPELGHALGVVDANDRQSVIIAYMFGFGPSQLLYGPLSDRFGRKATLIGGLLVFSLAGALSAFAPTFRLLLLSRALEGFGAGSSRVVAVTLVRDRYRGAEMARVMSLSMMVFMVIPILAPTIGQGILFVAPWRGIFGVLAIAGVAIVVWAWQRMDETLRPENRRDLSLRRVSAGFAETVRNRTTLAYTIATGFVFGGLMSFITSAQQIFQDTFGVEREFPLLFAIIALTMSAASFLNSRWVRRLGVARLSHSALWVLIGVSGLHGGLALLGWVSLPAFIVLEALTLFVFGFVGANFNSIAMEPMGHIAGTASSAIGAITTIISAVLGLVIGQLYDGTIVPLVLGTCILGVVSRIVLWVTGQRAGDPA
ncbi:MAG: multidrug effflux MFS transporter [Candidatus Eisenbacteria bacterium]